MLRLVLILLAASLAGAERWRMLPLPGAEVASPGFGGEPAELVRGAAPGKAFHVIAEAAVSVALARPLPPGRLAILRVGWDDWSVPAEVEIRADGGEPRRLRLTAPRVRPGSSTPDLEVDTWAFAAPFSRLEVRVVATEGRNAWGGIALAAAVAAPAAIPLDPAPAGTAGVVLQLTATEPPPQVEVAAWGYRYRRRVAMALRRPWPADGALRLRWSDFQEEPAEDGALRPDSLAGLEVGDPGHRCQVAVASWTYQPGTAAAVAPWNQLPALDRRADADGWRSGIPTYGFGRFGWNAYGGLLAGGLRDWRWTLEAVDGQGSRKTIDLDIRVGAPGGTFTPTQRRRVDWTGCDLLSVLRPAAAAGEVNAGHAFGADDARLRPSVITASLLIPGLLVTSDETEIALQRDGSTETPRLIACPQAGTAAWAPMPEAEGWLVAVWPDRAMPVLIAPQRRPSAVEAVPGGVVLRFAGPAGRIGLGQPSGWREVAVDDGLPQRIAPAARRLAAQLRAFPRRADQRFRIAGGAVEISERISHVAWDNDWDEPSEQVAPVPPTVAFAADQGVAVGWPAGAPAELGPPTKYGPWCGFAGAEARWTLPIPDHRQELYLRPLGDPLVPVVAAAIAPAGAARAADFPRSRDCLGAFWIRGPGSLALPLLDDAQRDAFLAGWRTAIDAAFDPGIWHLRREPYSGAVYPVSFGWRERTSDTLGDLNSGFGAALVGAGRFTRSSGDWAWARAHWPAIDGALRYVLMQHDWIQMQAGARETSGSSAIDMDVITFAGLSEYVALADGLGEADAAAQGRLLLARCGLSLGLRWIGMRWVAPDLPPARWGSISHGFSERLGWDLLGLDWDPDLVHGELALGLSWMGNYAPVYRQHLAALGAGFWRWWEYDLVGARLPDWRTDHPGNRNNHPANIAAHLYLRASLGAPTAELRAEAERAGLLRPGREAAGENGGFYALLLGRDAPVVLRDWGRAAPLAATWDPATRRAALRLRLTEPGRITLGLAAVPARIAVQGGARPLPAAAGDLDLDLPAGEVAVEVDVP